MQKTMVEFIMTAACVSLARACASHLARHEGATSSRVRDARQPLLPSTCERAPPAFDHSIPREKGTHLVYELVGIDETDGELAHGRIGVLSCGPRLLRVGHLRVIRGARLQP